MNTARLLYALLALPFAAGAETIQVGPGESFLTIQSAINAAAPGDVIEVAAGLYNENVVIDKSPLTLRGARAGSDARGRVVGAPSPALESIVSPATGSALLLASPAGAITIDGFYLSPAASSGGVVMSQTEASDGLTFACNFVTVAAGSTGTAFLLQQNAEDATISMNSFVAAAGSAETVLLDPAGSFDGLHFLDNEVLRTGPVAGTGLLTSGSLNVGPSALRAPLIRGNEFRGHETGFNGGKDSLQGAEISSNLFDGNEGGMAAGPANCVIEENEWKNNTRDGLRLTSFGDLIDTASGARGCIIKDNTFENNGTVASPSGHGDLVIDDQANGNLGTNQVLQNRFLSERAVCNNEPSGVLDAVRNYWGAEDGPSGNGPGSGGEVAGAGTVNFEPWYADEELMTLDFGSSALEENLTLGEGESIESESLEIAPSVVLTVGRGASVTAAQFDMQSGSSVQVQGGSLNAGKLTMQPGAVLDVVGGELSLDPLAIGQYHTISGSFTFFNCLGSLDINANTTFSGSTLGIASDIHVAAGVTMVVLGSLILDGCVLDSTGSYNLLVNFGAEFEMVRCEVTGAAMSLVGSDLLLRDNIFTNASAIVFSTVNGGSIYHNVFTGGAGALNILPGAVVTTQAEGWGNVGDLASVQNRLSLHLRAPSDPTRTLDGDGNLYVQPGDIVGAGIDIGELVDKAFAVEALLGYSSGHLQFDSLLPSTDWTNALHAEADESAVIGRFNTAVGLGFSYPDPDGTLLNGEVADLQMIAKPLEGRTRVFFRTKEESETTPVDIRLTAGNAGTGYFLNAPFTRNSPTLTVDGTAPEFATGATATQVQNLVPADVLDGGNLTRIGTVTVSFDVRDDLAGIDAGDVSLNFTGPVTLPGGLTGTIPVDIGGVSYLRHTFELTVNSATPNGTYNVDALAMDRSGNLATLAIGAIEIAKYQLNVTVAAQGLVTAPLSRNVTFVATDASGAVLNIWTIPVSFSAGQGTISLTEIPDGTAFLSAKTAWTLRARLAASFDAGGNGSVSFTAGSRLRGGDLNGNNLVNLVDFNILQASFNTAASVPDVSGDGQVNLTDFNILNANWLVAGDPP